MPKIGPILVLKTLSLFNCVLYIFYKNISHTLCCKLGLYLNNLPTLHSSKTHLYIIRTWQGEAVVGGWLVTQRANKSCLKQNYAMVI